MLQSFQQVRKFSTTPASRQLFAVIARDHGGEECLQRRLSVRREHIENAQKSYVKGTLRSGGALLDNDKDGKMVGSLMIIEAESLEKAHKFVEGDIYVKNNVWKSWEIYPYKAALGVALGTTK
ncbi:hypothetical protein BCR42DRAFT_405963 [Absidia repens]|uniref:YCII-related domain-containing protein n=1 Tax=Absidia repens TaxID=90262 RepID=A0A1X2IU82_9FUNG|nr:hypothetical protein BCR42DRAFT_405963 [Absidia repens]